MIRQLLDHCVPPQAYSVLVPLSSDQPESTLEVGGEMNRYSISAVGLLYERGYRGTYENISLAIVAVELQRSQHYV